MQMTPVVAREAAHLTVFQRTPNFSIPAANALIDDAEDASVKATYADRREAARNSPSGLGFAPGKLSALDATPEERRATYEAAWKRLGFGFVLAYHDLILDQDANDTAADFVREKIGVQVADAETRAKLIPRGFPFGTKRPSVDSDYYPTFNRDNVTLIDVRTDPISRVTPTGIETSQGHHDLDVIVFATGFDAMTGSLLRPEIVGRDGRTLREHWSAGPRTYLGLFVAGFPNLAVIAGPGSPSLLSNVLLSIEQHVDWLAELMVHAGRDGQVEARPEAEERWVAHVNERADATLYPKAQSYYMGDEIPGKPRVFMPYSGGVRGYRRILEKVVADGYDGLDLQPPVGDQRGDRPDVDGAPAGREHPRHGSTRTPR
jgi:cation diffusion facilitator CzcD-associated flavoprotein CzcO